MSTGYFLRDDGVLRHGHAAATNLEKEQWHNADQVHRGDPDAHDREDSFVPDLARWSRNNWQLSSESKRELILEAKRAHDLAVEGLPSVYNPRSSFNGNPAPDPAYSYQDEEPTPPPAPTIEPTGDEIIDMLAALPARVESLEREVPSVRRLASDNTSSIMDLRGDVVRINSSISNVTTSLATAKDITAALASSISDTADRIEKLEQQQASRLIIEVREPGLPPRVLPEAVYHKKFPLLLKLCRHLPGNRRNVWITGPAGSGKTTAANQVAEVLGLPFHAHGATLAPFDVSGFRDVNGNYQPSEFRLAFENGGVVLLDEIDAWSQEALVVLNAALSNGHMAFPDKIVYRHSNNVVIGSANTWGFGGDANYIARNKMDVASLDRFATVSWDYDENFESQLATNDEWCRIVQAVRAAAVRQEAQIVISPRATLNGCDLLNSGEFTNDEVVEAIFGRYRDMSDWSVIGAAAENFAETQPLNTAAVKTTSVQSPTSNGLFNLNAVDFSKAKVW